MDYSLIETLFNKYEYPEGFVPEYGTAGFRYHANHLDAIVFRCGVLMGIRSLLCQQNCGIMVTASHNPECDNGVKLIDYDGEMINKTWESHATQLVQCQNFDEFKKYLLMLNVNKNVTYSEKVLIGVDTRQSGHRLVKICIEGVNSVGLEACMLGQVTTPELHYYVYHSNNNNKNSLLQPVNYCTYLTNLFSEMISNNYSDEPVDVHVDCANGVGAVRLMEMKEHLLNVGLNLILYNTGDGVLNLNCGADFVEKENKFPENMENVLEYSQCCSFDGDADRIVYFTKINDTFSLLNGDKIACLFAQHIYNELPNKDSIGVIQTAYSNGASTNYIKETLSSIHVKCTNTGVQSLHKEAKQFDIGIYFEANGHGTVLFNKEYILHLSHYTDINSIQLCNLSKLLNQLTGCAIANLLSVQYILKSFGWMKWITLYNDLHTRQEKIYVNKEQFETTDYGRYCIKPLGLQESIDSILQKFPGARAFVRPSGTENIVRLYSECFDLNKLDIVSTLIKNNVLHFSK